jgi:hypothetical protein
VNGPNGRVLTCRGVQARPPGPIAPVVARLETPVAGQVPTISSLWWMKPTIAGLVDDSKRIRPAAEGRMGALLRTLSRTLPVLRRSLR